MTIEPTDIPGSDPRLLSPAAAGPPPAETAGAVRYSVLSPRAIWTAATLILLVGVGVAVWLLLAFGGGGQQLEAIRTAGTIVVGTGGAAALLLAARRQRSAEIALKQKDRDQADVARAHALQERVAAETREHQERVAADTREDAAARRITELYTKAADQLGSDKAPVRLAGLYALERLAQDNPSQRQTIVNVLCAYLRMPYDLPGEPPPNDSVPDLQAAHRERVQERQVRLAIQHLIADHLRPGDGATPVHTFWPDINLDLTGAVLIDLDFTGCSTRAATFTTTHFTGTARFKKAQFSGTAWFIGAQFSGLAWFDGAQFSGTATFATAQFRSIASFAWAQFNGTATFTWAQFHDFARFAGTQFSSTAVDPVFPDFPVVNFGGATFAKGAPDEVVRFLKSSVEEESKAQQSSGS